MIKRRPLPSSKDANLPIPEYVSSFLQDQLSQLVPYDRKIEWLQSEVWSKFVSEETDSSDVRRSRAIEKWLSNEEKNAITNDRLLFLDEEYNILPRLTWNSFRSFARNLVSTIIGNAPPEDLVGSYSGGASTSRKRTRSFPAAKYLGQADVTSDALPIFLDFLGRTPGWFSFADDMDYRIVSGNVLFTVPKKTDIDRVAAKEPDINMFLQKAVGDFLRTSLRRVGINLNDQSRNRTLARRGSIDGSLATLDLSSASDTISRQLVIELLPPAWYVHLDRIRSSITMIDGEEHVNEMFSSMGNGFTFELESLLFYVLTRTTAYFEGISGVISVYGDDIICPTALTLPLSWVLSEMGFTVNLEKSFWEGSFRESCGGHYDNGYDVTPFYVKKPLRKVSDVIHHANALRWWATRDGLCCDPEIYTLWVLLRDLVPRRFWGGRDHASIYQLVTPDHPWMVLSPYVKAKRLSRPERDGSYVHWLNSTWDRENASPEAVETSQVSYTTDFCRARPAAKADVFSLSTCFYEEI